MKIVICCYACVVNGYYGIFVCRHESLVKKRLCPALNMAICGGIISSIMCECSFSCVLYAPALELNYIIGLPTKLRILAIIKHFNCYK